MRKGGDSDDAIPVRALPLPKKNAAPTPDDAGQIMRKAAEGIILHAAKLDAIFTEHAALYAGLEAQSRMLLAIWSKFRPRLVVGENISIAEYAVPLLAAKRLGIPSISVPHGALQLPRRTRPDLPATRYAYSSAFCEDAFAKANPSLKEGIDSFTAVAMDNEYPWQRYGSLLPKDDKINILVITIPPMLATPLFFSNTLGEYTDALQKLCAPPPDLREKIRVMFKGHPATPDFWDYRLADIRQDMILPRDSILAEALATTGILLSLDYIGSPTCQAMWAGCAV